MIKRVSVFSFAAILIFLFCSCGLNINKVEKSSSIDKTISAADGAVSLNTSNQVGNIDVAYGEGKTANVSAAVKLASSQNISFDDILKNIDINLYEKGNTIYVAAVYKPTNENIWSWIKKASANTDLSINLTITVPESINNFSVNSKVGNISISNPKGLLNLQTDVGNIDVQNPSLIGLSTLKTDVGNINCTFDNKQSASGSMKADTDTGNIRVKTGGGVHAEKQYTDKKVVGSSSAITVDDNFVISAKTDVGNISVEN